MKFGVAPLALEEDKVYNQPCFLTQCNLGTVSSRAAAQPCPKIDTERAKKERQAAPAAPGGFRWPWQKEA